MAGSPVSAASSAVQELEIVEKVGALAIAVLGAKSTGLGAKSAGSGAKEVLYARPLDESESTYSRKLVAIRLFNKYQEKRNAPQFQELSDEDVKSDNL